MPEHGSRACYVTGCRRPECVEANRAYQRDWWTARRTPRPVETLALDLLEAVRLRLPPHGTMARYRRGCICTACRAANAARVRVQKTRA